MDLVDRVVYYKMITMKKVFCILCVLLSLGMVFSTCTSDDDNRPFKERNVSISGCKPTTRVGDEGEILYDKNEVIVVNGLKDGYLSINHENAMFNCEPGELKILATIDGNVIKVVETFDAVGANCICPYDLYCEVGPLVEGDYTIIIYQDATFDQVDAEEYTRFNVSYKKGLNKKYDI